MLDDLQGGNIFKGAVTSLHDASLCAKDDKQPKNKDTSSGNDLWEYRNLHTLCGIPVAADCLDLPIDSDSLLHNALQLVANPKSVVLRLSPDDNEGNDKYSELLYRQSRGEIRMINETKNFDASTANFIVWLTYEELSYALHPRYGFLRNELKEI